MTGFYIRPEIASTTAVPETIETIWLSTLYSPNGSTTGIIHRMICEELSSRQISLNSPVSIRVYAEIKNLDGTVVKLDCSTRPSDKRLNGWD